MKKMKHHDVGEKRRTGANLDAIVGALYFSMLSSRPYYLIYIIYDVMIFPSRILNPRRIISISTYREGKF